MKIRSMIIIFLISIANGLAVFTVQNSVLLILICFIITSIGVLILYYWLLEPLSNMKRQLEKEKKENLILEEKRKDFLANLAHELKTPVTSISGFVETLQNGAIEDVEMRTKFIDIISDETSRLERLIIDSLSLFDIESTREVSKEKIDVKEEINNTIDTILPIAEQNHIDINTDIDAMLYIYGSKDRFRQMVVNLIENAIKYSNPYGRIWVEGHREARGIVISIKDEGLGIEKLDTKRIFERFYRVDKSRSKEVGGTGLGLSIVKHIVAQFDATIDLDSEIGEGSTFYIIFDKVVN